jgi:predicted Zn-dependent protease
MREALAEVRRVEGSRGPVGDFCEAALHVWRARHGDRDGLELARARLADAARLRPGWAQVHLLSADLADLDGRPEQALAHRQQALLLGERHPALVYRVARSLADRQRWLEASQTLRLLGADIPPVPGLLRLAAEITLRVGDRPRAVELARRAAPADGRDYQARLWLAGILESAGRGKEAEELLRRTARDAGTVPDVWEALVQHLVRAQRWAEAAAVLGEVPHHLAPDQVPLTLARCNEALGRWGQAKALFALAAEAAPEDFLALTEAADYHLRRQERPAAATYLRRLLDPAVAAPEPSVAWARRHFALLLAEEAGDDAFAGALALLARNGPTSEDQRARALVLATRPAHRRGAIQILEAEGERQALPADVRFRLAQLYAAEGDEAKAAAHLLSLLASDGKNPEYLAYYVRTLLRCGQSAEARLWLARLEQVEPNASRTRQLRSEFRQATP